VEHKKRAKGKSEKGRKHMAKVISFFLLHVGSYFRVAYSNLYISEFYKKFTF
jgi:hypothetical protein